MATAANVVKFKRSAVPDKVPATTDLNLGELALNTYDGRIYLKKSVASTESIVTIQQVTGGTGVAVSDSGVVSIGQDVATTADVTFNSVTFPDETEPTTAWTGILPDPTYSGSSSIGNVTPAPLNLNNTGSSGENKTQLTLINTAGGGGTGSSIDFFTYTDAGNSLPGARLQAIDDSVFSANFSIVLKERYQSGNGQAGATWTFNSDGTTSLPGYTLPAADGTTGQVLASNGDGTAYWVTTSATSSGTVTAVSVVNTNGFTGTVATANSTPAITLKTTVNGLLKGNSTTGVVSAATAGTDYLTPSDIASLATQTYVTTAINNLINGSVSALDTLKELADAIGNDANFAATVTTALANRVRYDASQSLTENQQAQARLNIGAISLEDSFVAAIIMG
jgi:hypothetical protein